MITRCKVQCNVVEKSFVRNPDGYLYKAKFYAVYEGSEENKKFFAFTPALNLEVGVYKEDLFVPGKEYYLDFSEA